MGRSALLVDDIVAEFPIKSIPPIQGEPNYESINEIIQVLYANAASLATTYGGGRHGHIGLIMKPAIYATLSETPYATPIDPGPLPTFPVDRTYTAAERQQLRDHHAEDRRLYDNNTNMDQAHKGLLLEAIEDIFVQELRNRYTGYLSVSTRNILDHLLRRYGKITAANLDHNKKQMDDPYNPSEPIDNYFKRIDNAVQFASNGDIPFTQKQIMQTAYHAIFATGLYVDACKIWRNKPEHNKTWTALKTYFAQEYHDLREHNRITAHQTGYHSENTAELHSANVTMGITDALDNLALATTNNRTIIAQLTEANAVLTRANLTLTEQIT